jgi:hypothetical protein
MEEGRKKYQGGEGMIGLLILLAAFFVGGILGFFTACFLAYSKERQKEFSSMESTE